MQLKPPLKLRLAVLSIAHIMEINKTADNSYEIIGGVEGNLMKDLIRKFGVEYEVVVPPDGEYGRKTRNGSWTGLMGMVESGEADMACGGLALTPSRVKAVIDYIPVNKLFSTTFAIKRAEKVRLKNAYLYPFSSSVWACYLGMFFVMAAALFMISERKYTAGRVIFDLYGNALGKSFTFVADSWKAKFLLAVICIYAFVMTSSYSSLLLSFMTVPLQGETVKDLQQLSTAVTKGTHRCHLAKGTQIIPYLLSSKEKHLKSLGKAISRNKWYLESMDRSALKVISYNDAIISNSVLLDIAYRGNLEQQSKYLISSDSIGNSVIGVYLKRNFCCKRKLSDIMLRISESGIFDKYLRESAFLNILHTRQNEEEEVQQHTKISFEDISAALTILRVGYSISFVTLLAEILMKKCTKRSFCELSN